MLVSAVQRQASAVSARISPPSWASLPPHFHPTLLGHQRALSWAPLLCSSFLLATYFTHQFSSFQSLSHVQLFVTPWTVAHQASLSITNSQSLLKLFSIELVMPSNHLILCHPLVLLPSIFPSIRAFSNDSALRIRWPKYWSFSFSISPSNEGPSNPGILCILKINV